MQEAEGSLTCYISLFSTFGGVTMTPGEK